jgi:hypothetical protein
LMTTLRTGRANYLILAILLISAALMGLERTGLFAPLRPLVLLFFDWFILLAAFALLLGIANAGWHHLQQILSGSTGWGHSLALLGTLLVVLVTGLLNQRGVHSLPIEWIFDSIIGPGQATLFALLAFFMAAATYRFLRFNSPGGLWMIAGVLLILFVQTPLLHALLPPSVAQFAAWMVEVPGMAAMRGALLGSTFALAILGVRFLLSSR